MKAIQLLLFLFLAQVHWSLFGQLSPALNEQNTISHPAKTRVGAGSSSDQARDTIAYDYSFQRCEPGYLSLSAWGANPGEVYTWYHQSQVLKTSSTHQDNQLSFYARQTTEVWVGIGSVNSVRTIKRILVKVVPNPKPYIQSQSSSRVCPEEKVVLQVGGGEYFAWQRSVDFLNANGSEVRTQAITQTTTYSVLVYNEFGCQALASITLSLLPYPAPPSVATYQTRCGKGELTLSASGSSGRYRWYNNFHATNPVGYSDTLRINAQNAQTFFVTAVGANGCESPRQGGVTTAIPYPLPEAALLNIQSTSRCHADSIQVAILNLSQGNQAEWYRGNNHSPEKTTTPQNPSYTGFFSHSDTLSVRIRNNYTNCLSSPSETFVQINATPAPANANNPVLCVLGNTLFSVDSVPGMQYNWYTSPQNPRPIASSGTDIINKHFLRRMISEVDANNEYALWCEMVDTAHHCVSEKIKVTAYYNPLPDVQLNQSFQLCTGVQHTIRPICRTASNHLLYTWKSLDSDTSVLSNTEYLLLQSQRPEHKLISLQIKDTLTGCESGPFDRITHVEFIRGNKAPGFTQDVQCGRTVLTASGANGTESYQWKDDHSNVLGTGAQLVLGAGLLNHSLRLEIANSACSTQAISITPSFVPSPGSPSVSLAQICTGASAKLKATGAPDGFIYQWYDQTQRALNHFSSEYTTPQLNTTTTYYVSVVSPEGCESALIAAAVHVFPKPRISAATQICPGHLTELRGSNALQYSWYENETYIGTGEVLYVSPSIATTYSLIDPSNSSHCNKASVNLVPSFKNCAQSSSRVDQNDAHATQASSVSPNPFHSSAAVKLRKDRTFLSSALYAADGRIIASFQSDADLHDVGSELLPGIYWLSIRYADGSSESLRLLKE